MLKLNKYNYRCYYQEYHRHHPRNSNHKYNHNQNHKYNHHHHHNNYNKLAEWDKWIKRKSGFCTDAPYRSIFVRLFAKRKKTNWANILWS